MSEHDDGLDEQYRLFPMDDDPEQVSLQIIVDARRLMELRAAGHPLRMLLQ